MTLVSFIESDELNRTFNEYGAELDKMVGNDECCFPNLAVSNILVDVQNDKRERLVRASRDITQSSKKLIFALHRCVLLCHAWFYLIVTNQTDELPELCREQR